MWILGGEGGGEEGIGLEGLLLLFCGFMAVWRLGLGFGLRMV